MRSGPGRGVVPAQRRRYHVVSNVQDTAGGTGRSSQGGRDEAPFGRRRPPDHRIRRRIRQRERGRPDGHGDSSGGHPRHDVEERVPDDLCSATMARLRAHDPEVVIIGTGARHVFLPQELIAPLMHAGIGVEIMSTSAACRTYNILSAEGRRSSRSCCRSKKGVIDPVQSGSVLPRPCPMMMYPCRRGRAPSPRCLSASGASPRGRAFLAIGSPVPFRRTRLPGQEPERVDRLSVTLISKCSMTRPLARTPHVGDVLAAPHDSPSFT